MGVISEIEEIEYVYDTKKIIYDGVNIWPYIRLYMSYNIFGKGKIKADKRNVLTAISNLFYGFFNLFKKVDYIFFTDTADRKLIKDKYYDRIDFLSSKYKKKLVFELTTNRFYPLNEIPTKNITSKIPLYLLAKIIKLFISTKEVKGIDILVQIKNEKNIDIDFNSLLKDYISQYKLAKLLMKIYKPKAFILAPSYTNMPFVSAFKKEGVTVLEFQHGIIIKSHLAYNHKQNLDRFLFPDYLLSYGEFEKTIFDNNNNFINSDNVLPIGHFYIDYIRNKFVADKFFKQKTQDYKYKIAVTLQDTYDKKLMDFVNNAARKFTEIVFVIIPRSNMNIELVEKNTLVYSELNCYEAVLNCDYHCTIYSSCAIESLGLYKPNILINIDGRSIEHLGFLLEEKVNNILINTLDDFSDFVDSLKNDKQEISTQKYFRSNFKDNINVEFDKIFNS